MEMYPPPSSWRFTHTSKRQEFLQSGIVARAKVLIYLDATLGAIIAKVFPEIVGTMRA
jgi:hypothetical protein